MITYGNIKDFRYIDTYGFITPDTLYFLNEKSVYLDSRDTNIILSNRVGKQEDILNNLYHDILIIDNNVKPIYYVYINSKYMKILHDNNYGVSNNKYFIYKKKPLFDNTFISKMYGGGDSKIDMSGSTLMHNQNIISVLISYILTTENISDSITSLFSFFSSLVTLGTGGDFFLKIMKFTNDSKICLEKINNTIMEMDKYSVSYEILSELINIDGNLEIKINYNNFSDLSTQTKEIITSYISKFNNKQIISSILLDFMNILVKLIPIVSDWISLLSPNDSFIFARDFKIMVNADPEEIRLFIEKYVKWLPDYVVNIMDDNSTISGLYESIIMLCIKKLQEPILNMNDIVDIEVNRYLKIQSNIKRNRYMQYMIDTNLLLFVIGPGTVLAIDRNYKLIGFEKPSNITISILKSYYLHTFKLISYTYKFVVPFFYILLIIREELLLKINPAKKIKETPLNIVGNYIRSKVNHEIDSIVNNTSGVIDINSIHKDTTIKEIKTQINEIYKIPVIQQELIFLGHILDDNRSVSSYNIKSKSKLKLYVKQPDSIIIHKPKIEFIPVELNFKKGINKWFINT